MGLKANKLQELLTIRLANSDSLRICYFAMGERLIGGIHTSFAICSIRTLWRLYLYGFMDGCPYSLEHSFTTQSCMHAIMCYSLPYLSSGLPFLTGNMIKERCLNLQYFILLGCKISTSVATCFGGG